MQIIWKNKVLITQSTSLWKQVSLCCKCFSCFWIGSTFLSLQENRGWGSSIESGVGATTAWCWWKASNPLLKATNKQRRWCTRWDAEQQGQRNIWVLPTDIYRWKRAWLCRSFLPKASFQDQELRKATRTTWTSPFWFSQVWQRIPLKRNTTGWSFLNSFFSRSNLSCAWVLICGEKQEIMSWWHRLYGFKLATHE